MNYKTPIVLLILLQLGVTALSQTYYFRHYQVEDGLANSTVHCCIQDKKGFIWMGTKGGLNRFDGYTFKVFRHDEDDTTSIGSNFLRSLYEDEEGVIYAGTINGLYRYNDSAENFTTIRTGGEVRDIKRDGLNNLWFIIGGRLVKYNLATGKTFDFMQGDYFDATSVCITAGKEVWVSTSNGTIEHYNPAKNNFTSVRVFPDGAANRWIEKIYYSAANKIFIGTSTHGVKVYELATGKWYNVITNNTDKTGIFARDFIQTKSDEYWIATESGIFIYNTTDSSFVNLKKQYNNPYSLSDNAVYTLCKDKEGGIWAGTFFGGINYYPRPYISFQKFFPDNSFNALSGNAVREICRDRYGNFWIGTEDAGLNKFDKHTQTFTAFKPTGNKTDITYYNIHALLANDHELWVGTFEHGLDILDIKSGKVVKHYGADAKGGLVSNFIISIIKTTDNTIYVGTRNGLQKYNAATDMFERVPQVPPNFIYTLCEDHNGTVWAGTTDNGVYYFNTKTNTKGELKYDPKNKNSLSTNFVIDVYEDSRGTIWIGTEGGGLCRFNPLTKTFKRYNAKNGFPSTTALRILEDDQHMMWITTTRGLTKLDPATDAIITYTKSNGLLNDQFNYSSGFKDEDGTIYFGSVRGMISFNPSSFAPNNYTPPIYITGLEINNEPLTVHAGTVLEKSIAYTKKITLAYNQSYVSIGFAALAYTSPEMVEYAYIMEGLDNEWTYLKSNRKVYFTDVPPGNYTFKVKAKTGSGNWSSQPAVLNIEILPPIWAGTWAYALYITAALLLIFYIIRSYNQRLIARNQRKMELFQHEKEKEIYEAKIEFFTNVAHEIRTPLTLIKAPLEKVLKQTDARADIVPNLRLMEKNTNRLVDLTSQLLDFRKTETKGFSLNFVHTDINELVKETCSHFAAAAEQKQLSCHMDLPAENIHAYVDEEALKKILSNLISNAIKFAKHTAILELAYYNNEKKRFVIKVKSDGNMIPAHLGEKIFEPFYQVQQIENQKGTGIGLALARSLAELHKGALYVDKSATTINTFVLILPVHQAIEFDLR